MKLVIPVSALLSLTYAGYFLTGLRAADETPNILTASSYSPRATASDVVTKALAFKALLTTAQQATLEQTYTTTLARRWSNLPCGSGCRNGIQLGTLTATQLAAALAVIQAAAGTTANEGYDEFNQIRLADTFLNQSGGGSGYGEGLYYLAFLNTPSTTGAWMLQYGGHHYATNIAFNQGHVVGATPQFEGLEPTSFTINGTTYAPLSQEHDTMATLLASLTTAQLATAKLSATYSDVTMSPGESNGGNGTFPTTKVGVPVSSLSAAQKLLVFEAMKPWVRDVDDTVATNLLTIYQSELDGTYIAYTGNGVSGNPSSFLNTNTNYARIDGPSVWIEFICQTGVVFRNQIHYHSLWRDHLRDYGKDLSLTTALDASATGSTGSASPSKVGIYRSSAGLVLLDTNADGVCCSGDLIGTIGQAGDVALAGDWTGSGVKKFGLYRPATGLFLLDVNGNGTFDSGDKSLFLAAVAGDVPVVGDWTGSGIDRVAVFRSGTWYLDVNGDGSFVGRAFLGQNGDIPLVGNWNGTGTTSKVGIYRPTSVGGQPGNFFLVDSNGDGQYTSADVSLFFFGQQGDVPIVGDWNGDGKSKVGIFRPVGATGSIPGLFILDQNGNFAWDGLGTDKALYFAPYLSGPSISTTIQAGDLPITGNWVPGYTPTAAGLTIGQGQTRTGIYRPSTGTFFLDATADGTYQGRAFLGQLVGDLNCTP